MTTTTEDFGVYYGINDDGIWMSCSKCSLQIRCGMQPTLADLTDVATDHIHVCEGRK